MMRRVLIINSSMYLPGEGGYKRNLFLFDMLKKYGYDVKLLTGDFNHYSKRKRDIKKFREEYPDYNSIIIIPKLSYVKNVSIKRYLSDLIFSKDAVKWTIEHLQEFDVIYTSMPDMEIINGISKKCKELNKKLIVDVRDLHPEALRVVIKNPLLYKVLTYPMKCRADKAYAAADELIAVSQEYLNRAQLVNPNTSEPTVVYLGSSLKKFDKGIEKYAASITKKDGEFWIAYAGTLGESYDLDTVLIAAKKIYNDISNSIRFKILGQGPDEERLRKIVKDHNIHNVDFLGFLPYEVMAAYLSKCDLTLNAIKRSASASIINKVADYFSSGKPMLNSCCCKEQQEMVELNNVGLNYEPGDIQSFYSAVKKLYENDLLRLEYGRNARRLAEEKFDREESYKKILKIINKI